MVKQSSIKIHVDTCTVTQIQSDLSREVTAFGGEANAFLALENNSNVAFCLQLKLQIRQKWFNDTKDMLLSNGSSTAVNDSIISVNMKLCMRNILTQAVESSLKQRLTHWRKCHQLFKPANSLLTQLKVKQPLLRDKMVDCIKDLWEIDKKEWYINYFVPALRHVVGMLFPECRPSQWKNIISTQELLQLTIYKSLKDKMVKLEIGLWL